MGQTTTEIKSLEELESKFGCRTIEGLIDDQGNQLVEGDDDTLVVKRGEEAITIRLSVLNGSSNQSLEVEEEREELAEEEPEKKTGKIECRHCGVETDDNPFQACPDCQAAIKEERKTARARGYTL